MSLSRTEETFTPCSRQYAWRRMKFAWSNDKVWLALVDFLAGLLASISSAIRFIGLSVIIGCLIGYVHYLRKVIGMRSRNFNYVGGHEH